MDAVLGRMLCYYYWEDSVISILIDAFLLFKERVVVVPVIMLFDLFV